MLQRFFWHPIVSNRTTDSFDRISNAARISYETARILSHCIYVRSELWEEIDIFEKVLLQKEKLLPLKSILSSQ